MNKHHVGLIVEKNAFVDEGDGVVTFTNGLPITDNSEQRNGTRYDIDTLDISEYKGQVTADHVDALSHVIAQVEGVVKSGSQVVVNKIKYLVKENPYARLAYNLLLARNTSDFSIETYGPPPDDEGVYHNAVLIGLSQVVVGNNRNASVNKIVLNSIEQSKKDGLDTSELEETFTKQIRVESSHEVNNIKSEETKMSDVKEEPKTAAKEEVKNEAPAFDMNAFGELLKTTVADAVKPIADKVDAIEQNAFDKKAEEPAFKKDNNNGVKNVKNELGAMDYESRTEKQINKAMDFLARGDYDAAKELRQINEFNLEELKKEGIVKNSLTISDFGNFVICRELLTEIQGCRNDYTPLLTSTNWKETLSTQFAWLNRSGDINMQSVEFCDDGSDGNLKPISEYSATIRTADLEELAAVTPVCNAATRFLAADLLGDVATGYRNDYDRKRAQLVVARLEQAVEANGNSVIYDVNPTVEALVSFVSVWQELCNCTPNGVFIMSCTSWGEFVKAAVRAGISGPLGSWISTGGTQQILGKNVIVVSDDLLPALNSAETRSFVVNGVTVTVNHAVFYVNLDNFTGRTSGGLQYDLSTEASYEDNGTTKSAYQRNELVLRGSFFRGGAILNNDLVAGLLSPGVS